jgi:hypothetical protein
MPPPDPAVLASRFLDVIEQEIVPKTREGVAAGNKIFGAAILKRPISRWLLPERTRRRRTRCFTARFRR